MRKHNNYIILGTYNGERFLDAQLRSIQNQTCSNWTLLVRDDDSNDNTPAILKEYSRKDPRIQVLVDQKGRLGLTGNYNEMCGAALENKADTVFFCDQDDVWRSEKIETQVIAIQEFELKYGKECPYLVHSDLEVVDKQLKRIHRSFLTYSGIKNIKKSPIRTLLAQNYVTGCASAFNRALLEIASPIPKNVLTHDWWLALCASACGEIGFVEKSLTRYRQHFDNTIGARSYWNSINPFRTISIENFRKGYSNLIQSIFQARQLRERLSDRSLEITLRDLQCINSYATILKNKKIRRLIEARKNGIGRQGIIKQLIFYTLLILGTSFRRNQLYQPQQFRLTQPKFVDEKT